MKIILSRKGFDGSNGGIPSPIFGDGGLYSLPIPLERATTCRYEDILWNRSNLRELISSLRRRKKTQLEDAPHLDPDLVRGSLVNRHCEWRPIFGQSGGAETLLQNQGVGDPIDSKNRPLFLFFGWYREVTKTSNGYSYVKNAPNIHAIFGWLQVEQRIILTGPTDRKRVAHEKPWAADHPHVACGCYDHVANAIYVAPTRDDHLILGGRDTGLPAAGMFGRFAPEIHRLTQEGKSRRCWILPAWFYRGGAPKLGMNRESWRWTEIPDDREHVELQSVNIGQEFVFESKDHDEAKVFEWVERIVRAGQPSAMAVPSTGQ